MWQILPVPAAPSNQPVAFVWLAGLGCNLGDNRFTLFANGKEAARFTTASRESWEVAGPPGTRLKFHTIMVDRNHDRFGIMELVLPHRCSSRAKPLSSV